MPDRVDGAAPDRHAEPPPLVARLPTTVMPSLDGFRALAIGGVFAAHWDVLPGGYVGVNLFFVLSGFLITTLLTSEQLRTATIDLRGFYTRRAARLVPSMVLVVAVTTVVYTVGGVESRGTTIAAAVTSLCYVTNWAGFLTDRFLGVLNVTWSLSQEEQYYLLAPAFLRRMKPLREQSFRRLGWYLVTAWAVLAAARGVLALCYPTDVHTLYVNPIINMDGLLLGSGLSLLLYLRTASVPAWLSSTASSVIVMLVLLVVALRLPFTAHAVTLGTAIASAGAAMLLLNLTIHPLGPLSRLMQTSALRWIGQRSYTMYLVQLPALLLAHHLSHGHTEHLAVALDAAAFALTIAWAAASYPLEQALRARFGHHEKREPRAALN